MNDQRKVLVLERADLELVVTNPWAGIASLGCHTCGGFWPAAGTGQTDLPDGMTTMLLADTAGRIHGTWTGRLLPMVDVTPDPPSAPHVYIRPGDNTVFIWNHPHPLAYMPPGSLAGTWAPGGHAIHTGRYEASVMCESCGSRTPDAFDRVRGSHMCLRKSEHEYGLASEMTSAPFAVAGLPDQPCITTIDLGVA